MKTTPQTISPIYQLGSGKIHTKLHTTATSTGTHGLGMSTLTSLYEENPVEHASCNENQILKAIATVVHYESLEGRRGVMLSTAGM